MKIDFNLQGKYQINDNMNTTKAHEESARIAGESFGYTLDISSKDTDITAFGMEKLDAEDISMMASTKNISLESDANAVMSNSMSKEDFAEYLKEGYSPSNMEIEETVTNLDKIKATLIESGVIVEGYTDTISDEELDLITGSAALSGIIKDALKENYLPVTEDNVKAINDLINKASEIHAPTDDSMKYMIDNHLSVTADNLYIAEYSSSADTGKHAAFYMDKSGYTSAVPDSIDFDELKPQIEKIITDAGLPNNAESFEKAKWLLNKNLPLNKENLEALDDFSKIKFPLSPESVANSAASAISDGYDVKYADLTKSEGLLKQAVDIRNNFISDIDKLSDSEIKDRRLLEEARLLMSVDANLHLLKKGIAIDTSDLSKLVDTLKEAEKEIYKPLLTDKSDVISDDELSKRIDSYKEVNNAINDISLAPLESVAKALFINNNLTINEIKSEGNILADTYAKAEKSYESLMTAPRHDLGDSIKKAFRNVDDILADLSIEATRINEKAVRSLGYAGIEINEQNVEKLSIANTTVENVISLMTPKKTLELIRDGINPLDMDMDELETLLKKDNQETSDEKYSEFLWRLEKNNEISEVERNAFIGFYRLFNKIEKSDGRLVGNVLKADEKLTLSNLLSASRSNRAVSMDVSIDESFGTLEKLITYGESITDQILNAFRGRGTNNPTDSTQRNRSGENGSYVDEQYDEFKEALAKESDVKSILTALDEPVTVNNILATDYFINQKGNVFKNLFTEKNEKKNILKNKTDRLIESFNSKDEADAMYDEMIGEAKNQTAELMVESDSYIDFKQLKLINKQLTIIGNSKNTNAYEVPVEIDGQLTTINLKLIQDDSEKGKISLSFETANTGLISAEFSVNKDIASGYIVSESEAGNDLLKSKENGIKNAFSATGFSLNSLFYTKKADINISKSFDGSNTKIPTNQLYKLSKEIITSIVKR